MNKGYLFATLSVFFWSTMTPVSKALMRDAGGFEVQLWRAGVGAAALLAVIVAGGRLPDLKSLVRREGPRLAGYGFVGFFLYTTLHLYTLSVVSGQLTVVVNYLWPVFTVCLSCLILREPLHPADAVALALSFAGVAVATLGGGAGSAFTSRTALGLLATVAAALSFAWFSVKNKQLGEDQTLCMFVYNLTSAVLAFPFALHAGFARHTPALVAGLTWLGVSGGALGNLFWAMALDRSDASKIANLAYGTPILSVFICGTVLGEGLHLSSFVGLALILLGFAVQRRYSVRRERAT